MAKRSKKKIKKKKKISKKLRSSEKNQELTINAYMLNSVSINVLPTDLSIENLFQDYPLMMSDDNGNFYVPSFGINQLENLEIISHIQEADLVINTTPIGMTMKSEDSFSSNAIPLGQEIWKSLLEKN